MGTEMSEDRVAEFRHRAAECRLKARKACDHNDKVAWRMIEKAWLTLAKSKKEHDGLARPPDAPSARLFFEADKRSPTPAPETR
jgi:hypothetical protein